MRPSGWNGRLRGLLAAVLLLAGAIPVLAQDEESRGVLKKGALDGTTDAEFKAAYPEYFPKVGEGKARPADIPNIFENNWYLNVGNVYMKVTNLGLVANPYTNLSSDPSGQWPGASGIEYLNAIVLAVGGVNPLASDPNAVRRVSYFTEWRPPSLDREDRVYRAYDGIINGTRFSNDDSDQDLLTGEPRIDEDFLDGRDNDGDGKIDEDYAAIGQQMFSCVIRDDTPQAINATFNEKHVPLGLEVRQRAWAYSIPGFTDFNVVEWTVFNRSGHTLDSMVVGGLVDMDSGPVEKTNYYTEDMDLAGFPSGEFISLTTATDKRMQDSTMRAENVPRGFLADSALCPRFEVRVNAFSIVDDDGDEGKTPGIPTFLLVDHTVDPLGLTGPARVGFKAFRSYVGGTPYTQGGRPNIDQERFELMSGKEPNGVDEESGLIDQPPGDQKGDYVEWWSCGPWQDVPDGGSVQVTIAFAVARGDLRTAIQYANDYQQFVAGTLQGGAAALFAKYPSLDNAYAVQVAREGIYEDRPDWPLLTNGHGRETPIKPKAGEGAITAQDCHDEIPRTVTSTQPEPDWFDFDCDYCTGAYDSRAGRGMFHRTWNADAPPPGPNLNAATNYNYSDNPDRQVVAAGDNQVTLAWDNLSETSADPKSGWFDFRGYRVWKAANWTRPVGAAGPSDEDWSLIGEFRQFSYRDAITNELIPRNYTWQQVAPDESVKVCPRMFVPNYRYPVGSAHCQNGCVDTATVDICLDLWDVWDRQSGMVIKPDTSVRCVGDPTCELEVACINGRQNCQAPGNSEARTRYPVGRYQLVDREVKNGFVYFYSVTAFDSTGFRASKLELSGRRSAVEAEGVTPQVGTRTGRQVWVVPNPYRGFSRIGDRPSAWDLTPNGTDPTGTHIDFFGLPRGVWTIRIFTVSGDLVAEIKSTDPVNESIRAPVVDSDGQQHPGVNRQQDNPDDGQARWNLISRNGQDIVSGIYLFTVKSSQGMQRGKFVVIR